MRAVRLTAAALGMAALALAGCASYSDSFGSIERSLGAHDPHAALRILERQRRLNGDEALYLMNKGMLLRMAGDLEGSRAALEAAKQRIDALYAVSISEQTASFLINDATRSYIGAPFEQVLIHVYLALDYLELGRLDDARVEVLQADERLREQAQSLGRRYHDDPLMRLLAGAIFEARGERSDAMISYRKAYDTYRLSGVKPPRTLGLDLVRLAHALGLDAEAKTYREAFDLSTSTATTNDSELVFFLHEGLAPIKREHGVTVLDPGTGRFIRVSLPYYQQRPVALSGARLRIGGQTVATALAEDIGAIVQRELHEEMPTITARAIARIIAKDKAAKQAGKQDAAVGIAINIANVLTERADTRSWLTLPDRVHVAAVALPPGHYAATVELLGTAGQVVATHTFGDVVIAAGQSRFLSYHWVSPRAGAHVGS